MYLRRAHRPAHSVAEVPGFFISHTIERHHMQIVRSTIPRHDKLTTQTGEFITFDHLAEVLLASGSFANRVRVERDIQELFYLVEAAQ